MTGVGIGTITDNDATPSFSINDVTINEAAGTATFTVTLSAASGQATSVNWGLSNGTALAGSDYTNNSGTLNFAPGVTTQTITVAILNDSPRVYEGAETFNVNLSGAVNAGIADNRGVATIMDDGTGSGGSDNDWPIISSVSAATVTEGGTLVHTVILSNASNSATTFSYALAGETATAGTDFTMAATFSNGVTYNGATGLITVPAGVISFTVSYATTGDKLDEQNEDNPADRWWCHRDRQHYR